MAANNTVIDWLYKALMVINNPDIHDSHDLDRVQLSAERCYRLHTTKRTIKQIENYVYDNPMDEQFVITGKGKNPLKEKPNNEWHFKHYVDLQFTELGENMMLMKGL